MSDDKIRRIKDIAAQKAFETYGEVVGKLCEEAGIDVLQAIAGTTHVHSAVLFDEKGRAVAVRAQWDCVADKETIERAIQMAKDQKKFPEG